MKILFVIALMVIIPIKTVEAMDERTSQANILKDELIQQQKSINEMLNEINEVGYFDDKREVVYLPLTQAVSSLNKATQQLTNLISGSIEYTQQSDQKISVQSSELNNAKRDVNELQNSFSLLQSTIRITLERIDKLTSAIEENSSINNTQKALIDDSIAQLKRHDSNLTLLEQIFSTTSESLINKSALIESSLKSLDKDIIANQQLVDGQITSVDNELNQSRSYGVIITGLILMLSIIIFLFLKHSIRRGKVDVQNQILETRSAIQDETIKLDNKLIDLLDAQLKVQYETGQTASQSVNESIDHSLAIKVADELIRLQKNISRMDQNTKGLTPLVKGIERIQNNFLANGYEMIQMINKKYSEGMNVDVVNFIEDDELGEDEKVITKIIKPQINFENVLIQRAQVEVSIG